MWMPNQAKNEKMESYQIINLTTGNLFPLNKSDLTFTFIFLMSRSHSHLSYIYKQQNLFYLVKVNLKTECIYIIYL